MATITTWKYLAPKPKSFYKQLFVNGRIQARLLYGLYRNAEEPQSPEEIAAPPTTCRLKPCEKRLRIAKEIRRRFQRTSPPRKHCSPPNSTPPRKAGCSHRKKWWSCAGDESVSG